MSSGPAQGASFGSSSLRATRKYRLSAETAAVDVADGKQIVMLPAGAVVECTGEGSRAEGGMVEVYWKDRLLSVFAVDLEQRGEYAK